LAGISEPEVPSNEQIDHSIIFFQLFIRVSMGEKQ